MKQCTKCKIGKTLSHFHRCKGYEDGHYYVCKECRSAYNTIARSNNKYRYNNDIEYRLRRLKDKKKSYYRHKNKINSKRRNERKNNSQLRQKEKEYRIYYYNINKELLSKKKKKKYRQDKKNNKRYSLYKKKRNRYLKKKLKLDLNYKISHAIRTRMGIAIKNQYRAGSAIKDLGCNINFFMAYLEKQFYSHPKTGRKMTWKNHSRTGWHIDHINPLNRFDLINRDQFLKACHYTNLRPLWWDENLSRRRKNQ